MGNAHKFTPIAYTLRMCVKSTCLYNDKGRKTLQKITKFSETWSSEELTKVVVWCPGNRFRVSTDGQSLVPHKTFN